MEPTDLLTSVARDISALHDPDLILTGLLRRLRAGSGCALAYLSLNDPRARETQIRFADGVRTDAYSRIRMPIGTGVLGMAAAGVTSESADYLPDLAKLHIESVDAAVHGEGVRAILAAPLRAGGDVVGALTVANRMPGSFTSDQRSLLEQAALIGSVAVEVYLLRREVAARQSAFDEELARVTERTTDAMARLRLSEILASALADGKGSADLLDLAAREITGTVHIASTVGNPRDGAVVLPLIHEGAIEIASDDQRAVRIMGPTIATYSSIAVLYENAIEDARHLREAELVERLIDPPPQQSGHTPRTGIPGNGDLQVVVLETEDALVVRPVLAAVRRSLGSRGIVASRRGSIIAITRKSDESISELSNELNGYRYYGGVATAPSEPRIAAAYSESVLVARAMRNLGRSKVFARRSDLGVVAFAIGDSANGAQEFVTTRLAPIATSSPRDRALRETALAYLDSQSSVSSVSAELGVHENTVRQRIERLDRLTPGWRRGPDSLDFHVALRTFALLEARGAS